MKENRFELGEKVVVLNNKDEITKINSLVDLVKNLFDNDNKLNYCHIEEGKVGTVVDYDVYTDQNSTKKVIYTLKFDDGECMCSEDMLDIYEEQHTDDDEEYECNDIEIYINIDDEGINVDCSCSQESLEKLENMLDKYFGEFIKEAKKVN